MKKIVTAFSLSLVLAVGPALAHHPAEEMVDEEVYAMIDDMVADTPHATLVFDEEMGETEITTESVSDAEDMIDDYLLATLSALEEDVTVTITFEDVATVTYEDEVEQAESASQTNSGYTNQINSGYTNVLPEGGEWGRRVIITVDTLLCDPGWVEGDPLPGSECKNILPY